MRVGGVDVREMSFDDLRATIGVVTQDGHLFHDSVRENLRYADLSPPTPTCGTCCARFASTV